MSKKRLILLDSHAILHRAYHALPDFASSKGEPTGGLYGLVSMLIGIIEKLKPDYVVACYDLPKPTYRHEAYKDYKAGRAKTDEALIAQIIRSRDVFKAFSIPVYEHEGFEADDLLGTITEQLKKQKDIEIIIASGDMDTMQLVDGTRVQVYTLKKGIKDTILYNEDAVKERYGFGPELLPDYKGLRGDPSDNIIGIKGIGEKTATELITNFGTIEQIYKVLKKNEEKLKEVVSDRMIELLKAGEEEALFSKMLATIRRDAPIDFVLPEKSWKETVQIETVLELFKTLEFKTIGIRVKELLGLTDAFGDALTDSGGETGGTSEKIVSEPVDSVTFKRAQIALWVLDSNMTSPTKDDILLHTKTKTLVDALVVLEKRVTEQNLDRVYRDIELPLIDIIDRMEKRGIAIDTEVLKELSKTYHAELEKLEQNIWREAGEEFNINSPKQLGHILFEKLALKAKGQRKTAGGAMSTRESELEKLKDLHPIVDHIFKYRELQKLLSTYIDVVPSLIKEDGRLHTTFLQTGTTTGRMSSQNPNIQNIPIKTDLGRAIRDSFVAEKGMVLIECDYSQIQLRVAAFLSKDEKLIDIFKSGRDVHTEVAARVFKVAADQVDKEMRRKAKVINFGILYGMGVNALKQNLGGTREEAQHFYDEYFSTFTGLATYLKEVKEKAHKTGYTETLFGRRRYFEGIMSKLPFIRAQAERMAINAPIQGTESDIMKLAMIKVDTELRTIPGAALLLQIHDSLIGEIPEKKVTEAANKIMRAMESVLTSKETEGVPIPVHVSYGADWGHMRDL